MSMYVKRGKTYLTLNDHVVRTISGQSVTNITAYGRARPWWKHDPDVDEVHHLDVRPSDDRGRTFEAIMKQKGVAMAFGTARGRLLDGTVGTRTAWWLVCTFPEKVEEPNAERK